MIIEGPDHVTEAVLAEIERAPNPRFRAIMTALVKHLHAFIRESKLTEEAFHQGCAIINAIDIFDKSPHAERRINIYRGSQADIGTAGCVRPRSRLASANRCNPRNWAIPVSTETEID